MPAYNLNALFSSSAHEDDLLRNISLSQDSVQTFRDARDKVRKCLRAGLPLVLRHGWVDDEPPPQPRFVPQGSWAYRTLNAPARRPQQADLDYGVYLPMNFANGAPPAAGAKLYFEAVEQVLGPLAKEENWQLDSANGNCVRLIIAMDKHIDVPCYVMRREDFESQLAVNRVLMDSAHAEETREWALDWIPVHGVLRATRDNGWRPDDPRPLYDWWRGAVEAHGEQLRRVVRYIKAARDHQTWPDDAAPKSLLLTVAVVSHFERHDRRDDLAAAAVCRRIADHLRRRDPVENPIRAGQDLASSLDEEGTRHHACAWLESLADGLDYGTLRASEPAKAIEAVRPEFGRRLPDDPERIALDTVATTSKTRQTAPALVGSVHSG
jgi:hypothetical protein